MDGMEHDVPRVVRMEGEFFLGPWGYLKALNKKAIFWGNEIHLENQLLLISINFTLKTSLTVA